MKEFITKNALFCFHLLGCIFGFHADFWSPQIVRLFTHWSNGNLLIIPESITIDIC